MCGEHVLASVVYGWSDEHIACDDFLEGLDDEHVQSCREGFLPCDIYRARPRQVRYVHPPPQPCHVPTIQTRSVSTRS